MKRRQLLWSSVALLAASAFSTQASQRIMTVYKDPTCGCCEAWAEAMAKAGFAVDIRHVDDIAAVKRQFSVPPSMEGCHTAVVDGYFIEGHVPLEAVERVLKERPDIAGIAVPGMPNGSLGMGDDPTVASYDVISADGKGNSTVYMRVRPNGA